MEKYRYALIDCSASENNLVELCDSLAEAVSHKNRLACRPDIYAARVEKKGQNSFVVLDYLVRKTDGTPL